MVWLTEVVCSAGTIALSNQTILFISTSMGFSLLVTAWIFYRYGKCHGARGTVLTQLRTESLVVFSIQQLPFLSG